MDKRVLREQVLSKRESLSRESKIQYDKEILNELIKSDIYKSAKKIFTYISFGSEVDTIEFIKYALNDSKEVYVPKTNKSIKEMIAVSIHNFNNMTVDKWGILEPSIVDKNQIGEDFDLIIMPGVAFDRSCNRIGYGGGYYDKYISKHRGNAKLVALAYDVQIVDNIESEEHDIKPDKVVTNKILKIIKK